MCESSEHICRKEIKYSALDIDLIEYGGGGGGGVFLQKCLYKHTFESNCVVPLRAKLIKALLFGFNLVVMNL